MPGKTAAPHEIPYAIEADSPASAEEATKPMAERVHERLDAIDLSQLVVPGSSDGKIVIVKDGAAAYKAMSGDATIDEDGKLAIGGKKIVTEMLVDLGVTTGKIANKAITLAKLAEALGLTEGYFADGAVTSRKLKPTRGLIQATGSLNLTNSYQDIPGAVWEITPSVPSRAQLVLIFNFEITEAAAELGCSGIISVDGVDQFNAVADMAAPAAGHSATVATIQDLSLSAAPHSIKMRAQKFPNIGKASALSGATRMMFNLMAS
jgi:hypothetical protein